MLHDVLCDLLLVCDSKANTVDCLLNHHIGSSVRRGPLTFTVIDFRPFWNSQRYASAGIRMPIHG
jgi:hypothetical protein